MIDAGTGLTFSTSPPADRPAPAVAEIGAALRRHPGQWAQVYVADRLALAESYRDAVRDGRKFGPGHDAAIVKFGAEHRVYARSTP